MFDPVLVDGADAAPRHGQQRGGAAAGVQCALYSAQQVIGFKDEKHLARHTVEDLAYLGYEVGCVVLYLLILKTKRGLKQDSYLLIIQNTNFFDEF